MQIEQDTELAYHCECFLKVLQQHSDVFPEWLATEEMFMAAWGLKCTRVFGSGMGTTCMIPMADAFNHCPHEYSVETINAKLQLEGRKNPDYYRISKYMSDVTPIFKKHGSNEEILNSTDVKGRFNRKLYEGNQETLSIGNVRENLKLKEVWQIPFQYDAWEEDNETDDSDEDVDEPKWTRKRK